MKKAALLIYPGFCNREIALTVATPGMLGKGTDVFAVSGEPVRCEEGMAVLPDKTLDEFDGGDYDCLLLSGIGGNPDAVLYDERYTEFLRGLDGTGILIGAISLAPALLGRAGLLKGKRFCVGMVEEDRDEPDFFEYENLQRAPLVADGLGLRRREGLWGEVKPPYKPEDWIFHAFKNEG